MRGFFAAHTFRSEQSPYNRRVPSKYSEVFSQYAKFVDSAYVSFLSRLGLDCPAAKAEGAIITDCEGKTYVDCVSGYGLFALGHNNPAIVRALKDQLDQRQLFTKPLVTEPLVRLARYLAEFAPGDLSCSFICNSGSEAIDSAIKLSRLCKRKTKIIAAENSFHGYTYGALSASGIPRFARPFAPMLPGIVHVPFGNAEALRQAICEDTAAVLLEPIQHEVGVTLPPEGYFNAVRKLCDDNEVVLIIDEIKTGLGKIGYLFACESFGITPDILVLGKSLGGGLMPIGAMIAKREIWTRFGLSFPMSASSFAGNVLSCRAAIATLEVLRYEGLLESSREKAQLLLSGLSRCQEKYPMILKSVSGVGLLAGIETFRPEVALELARKLILNHVLALPAFANPAVLIIEPPLVISVGEIQQVLTALERSCEELSASTHAVIA